MGRLAVQTLSETPGIELAGTLVRGSDAAAIFELSRPDVLVDFTVASAARELGPLAAERGIRPVIGTSGLNDQDVARLRDACASSGIGGLIVPNFSVGAVLQMRMAAEAAAHIPCELIHETHHPGKKDAPSGTALATARGVRARSGREVRIESERREGVVAVQRVEFVQAGERLTLTHEVRDRSAYMPGLVLAVRQVRGLRELAIGLDSLLR
jgi:4-hydroxy-tetrahydrodipicolinate reductase